MEGVRMERSSSFKHSEKQLRCIGNIACGGAMQRLWMQIHSDVSGLPIQILSSRCSALGSAILAAVASEFILPLIRCWWNGEISDRDFT
jgi:ribulose kinase